MEDTRKCGDCANFKTCGAVQADDTPSSLMCEDYTPAGGQRDVAGAAPAAPATQPPAAPAATPPAAPAATQPPAAPVDAGNRMATPQAPPQQFAEVPPAPPAAPGATMPPAAPGAVPPAAPGMTPPPPPPAGAVPPAAPGMTPPPPPAGAVPPAQTTPPATDGEAPDMSWDLYAEAPMSRYVKPKSARLLLEAGNVGLNTANYKTPRELHEALIALKRGAQEQPAAPAVPPAAAPAAPDMPPVTGQESPAVPTAAAPAAAPAAPPAPPVATPPAAPVMSTPDPECSKTLAPARTMMDMQDGGSAVATDRLVSSNTRLRAVFNELREKINDTERNLAELRGMLVMVERFVD